MEIKRLLNSLQMRMVLIFGGTIAATLVTVSLVFVFTIDNQLTEVSESEARRAELIAQTLAQVYLLGGPDAAAGTLSFLDQEALLLTGDNTLAAASPSLAGALKDADLYDDKEFTRDDLANLGINYEVLLVQIESGSGEALVADPNDLLFAGAVARGEPELADFLAFADSAPGDAGDSFTYSDDPVFSVQSASVQEFSAPEFDLDFTPAPSPQSAPPPPSAEPDAPDATSGGDSGDADEGFAPASVEEGGTGRITLSPADSVTLDGSVEVLVPPPLTLSDADVTLELSSSGQTFSMAENAAAFTEFARSASGDAVPFESTLDSPGRVAPLDPEPASARQGDGGQLRARLGGARLANRVPPLLSGTPSYNVLYEFIDPTVERFRTRVLGLILLSWMAAGLVAVGVVFVMARNSIKPLNAITSAFQSLGFGNMGQRVPERGVEEIRMLSSTFNRVAGQLEDAEQQRRLFTADTAHELRTPLTNIKGYLEAIQDGVLEPDPEVIAGLHQQAEYMTKMVEDLGLINLSDSGRLEVDPRPGDLAAALNEWMVGFTQRATERNIKLEYSGPEELEYEFDPLRLQQVINNLVNNALIHTGTAGLVGVDLSDHDDRAEITVHDNGRGIAADDLERIFDRFYRVDRSRSRATGGSGLGLTIAKKLVDLMNGRIEVQSKLNEGTRFIITLPLADRG